jgi:hypothetical protein
MVGPGPGVIKHLGKAAVPGTWLQPTVSSNQGQGIGTYPLPTDVVTLNARSINDTFCNMDTGVNSYLDHLGLMFVTQFVLTLYGAGLRRPFGSLESVKDVPDWLHTHRIPVLVLDTLFVVFLLFMWWRLINVLDLLTFLVSFFAFAGVGTLLANRIDLIRSTAVSIAGVGIAFYVIYWR